MSGRMATMGCSASIPTAFRRRSARRDLHVGRQRHDEGHCAAGSALHTGAGHAPNPYLGAGFFWYTEGNSSYNALQIDLIRRLSKGLQVRGNFTWSKNLDMNSALTGAQASNEAQMIDEPE